MAYYCELNQEDFAMKKLFVLLSATILVLAYSMPVIAAVSNPALTVKLEATPEVINGKDVLTVNWTITPNKANLQLRGSSGIRLAYDNTVLKLIRFSGSGSEYTPTETLSGMPGAARLGVYEDAIVDVRAARSSDGSVGFATIELGHPEYIYDCVQNTEQTLASIRFAFRDGKSQANLNNNSIRLMTIAEMERLVQPAAVNISVASAAATNAEYVYRSRSSADSLSAPVITGPNIGSSQNETSDDSIKDTSIPNTNPQTPIEVETIVEEGVSSVEIKDIKVDPTKDKSIVIIAKLPKNAKQDQITSFKAIIPRLVFADFLKTGADLVVENPISTIKLSALALEAVSKAGDGDVEWTASIVNAAGLTDLQKGIIDNSPAYDFMITIGGKKVTELQGGNAVIIVPYTLGKDKNDNPENPYAIVVFCLNADNSLTLQRGYYQTGKIIFTTKHFSRFVIKHSELTFSDIDNAPAWSKNAALFVAARDLIVGLTDHMLDPTRIVTRGEFTATLMNAYGVKPDPAATDNFSDVNSTAAYAPYIATAKKYGIAAGVGNNEFAPERQISREEMFTLLYRTLSNIGEAPMKSANGKTLSSFTDSSTISSWAKDAVNALLQAGMIDGTGNNMLSPSLLCDRATMAQMIFNLLTR